jgi:glyoxylase-like metal-dependent hydrolase (beta-lactamase superfamily II)
MRWRQASGCSVIDLRDLKWIWLTHDGADHTGNLQKVLEAAPNQMALEQILAQAKGRASRD